MRAGEENQKPQMNADAGGSSKSERTKTIFWNLSSEMIGIYLWFLKFSGILLKLVQ